MKLFRLMVRVSWASMLFGAAACTERPAGIEDMAQRITSNLVDPTAVSSTPREAIRLTEGFGPALSKSVAANEGYRAAVALEAEATSRVGVAESVRRPQLSATATVGSVRETGGSATAGVAGGVNVSQLIYDAGESTAAINRATAEALIARAERAVLANDLALEAARAWIDAWQFEVRLDLLRARTAEMSVLVEQIERMASNGISDRADVDAALRQIVDIRLEESRLQAELAEARVRFGRHFGDVPLRVGKPAMLVSLAQARAFAADWRSAPQLQARAAAVIAAQNAVAEAQSEFRPRVRLQSGARSPIERGDPTDLSVGFGIEYSFNDGGLRARRLDAARSQEVAQRERLAESQATIDAALRSAFTRLDGLNRALPLVAEQVRLSVSEGTTTRSQLVTGQSSLRQLVEAEIGNYRVRDREISLQAEQHLLLLTIAARTGALAKHIGLFHFSER